MTMFASWHHCTKIILGASHDNGYSRILSKLMTDNIAPGKVALLQGPPFAAELAQLSTSIFPRIQFGELFMTTKLEMGGSSYVQMATTGGLPMPRKTSSPIMPAAVVHKAALMRPDKGTFISISANVRTCTTLLNSSTLPHATITTSIQINATRLTANIHTPTS